jgi:hypothetical protein
MEEVDLILGFANAQRNERWAAKLRRFEAQIAKPAAELATGMTCSPEDYEWQMLWAPMKVQNHMLDLLTVLTSKRTIKLLKTDFVNCLMTPSLAT